MESNKHANTYVKKKNCADVLYSFYLRGQSKISSLPIEATED
jgi:hypothetical protein